MKTILRFLYQKWIRRRCPHICACCKYREEHYMECFTKMSQRRRDALLDPEDGFKCEKCGIDLREWCKIDFDEDDDYEEFVTEYGFKFCPNCGRKIVEE